MELEILAEQFGFGAPQQIQLQVVDICLRT